MPGVIGPIAKGGLRAKDKVLAEYLKPLGYSTAIVGKWHLGQRPEYLPGSRGFDYYLGIPYSADMGTFARVTGCANSSSVFVQLEKVDERLRTEIVDPGTPPLPLVQQINNVTNILEQPLDFTTLTPKYSAFAVDFIENHKTNPFLLYFPFSHVHMAMEGITPNKQWADCKFLNSTPRGRFGDALAEVDWTIKQVVDTLSRTGVLNNTLIIFTSDNGPWLQGKLGAGSVGIFSGQYSGYWNTGKGSNWEGGIRAPAFAYWPGHITAGSLSSETVSSLDIVPTLVKLAGGSFPSNYTIDGKDITPVFLGGKSEWASDYLFHYWNKDIYAVRYGRFKAHFITAPGLGGCSQVNCHTIHHSPPLLFDIDADPSEKYLYNESDASAIIANITAAKENW
eukprot:CAMPEP_0174261264 /NCGR_PEP_ID=MMETSP0439-20130205/11332_1 /TAXON_ID=0 /ORGANISM="Stereomyxa ramosa, Strain Chinc5" /LENGTH=393 /DNA_ID=CAMNT_0015345717 /DNA_START=306 /DNA_END=1484 /DNA_ORIENTATION=+